MAILIRDREADQLIRALADRTGESITEAIKEAVRERFRTLPPGEDEIAVRKRKLAKLIAKSAAMPTVDDRTPDAIIGYNELGHFG